MFRLGLLCIALLQAASVCCQDIPDEFQQNIQFILYNVENHPIYSSNSTTDTLEVQQHCRYSDKIAVIVHGYTESCNQQWVPQMIDNLNTFRGGCIICMDYSFYARTSNYTLLVTQFPSIATVLTNKLQQLRYISTNLHLFGFSFGGQLVLQAGRNVGRYVIRSIDTCEPAGPGFDTNPTYRALSATDAALNVNCMHTSSNLGTTNYNCHQDWLMNCAHNQPAASVFPFGDHGLCPYFYNFAFRNQFYAVRKPSVCGNSSSQDYDIGRKLITAGYHDDLSAFVRDFQPIRGLLYANTYKFAPYNVNVTAPRNSTLPF